MYQADGQSSLKVIGETNITLSRIKHCFTLEALVVENIDVDVLAGVLFMTVNNIAFLPSQQQILLSDGIILHYCDQPSHGAHVVHRAQACVLQAFSLCNYSAAREFPWAINSHWQISWGQ